MNYLLRPKSWLLIVLFLAAPAFFLAWWGVSGVEVVPQSQVIKNVIPTSQADDSLKVSADSSPMEKTSQSFTVRNPQGLALASFPWKKAAWTTSTPKEFKRSTNNW